MQYLYNGVGPLPDIYTVWTPELQAEYGAAVVSVHEDTGDYYLTLHRDYSYYYPRVDADGRLATLYNGGMFKAESGQWVEATKPGILNAIWSNVDVIYADGIITDDADGIYIAASDPIPVNPPNPAAMLMGYMVGQAIKLMRGNSQPGDTEPAYTELAYLESDGTQWIDTNVKGTLNTSYLLVVQATKGVAPKTAVVFGSRSAANSNNVSTVFGTSGADAYISDFGSYTSTRLQISPVDALNKVEIYNSKSLRYVKDLVTGDYSESSKSWANDFTTPSNLLFGAKSTGFASAMVNFTGKYFACKIYENDVLIRDFIPVLDTNGVPCMYDKVSNEYFYNQGTGEFAYA